MTEFDNQITSQLDNTDNLVVGDYNDSNLE